MRLPRPRSWADIADAIEDSPRVVVSSEAEAIALGARLGATVEVTTPEAAIGAPTIDRFDRLVQVAEAVDAPMFAIDRGIDRCLLGWRHRGDPKALAETARYEDVADRLREFPGPERTLERADRLDGPVTVIAPELFDTLQRGILPHDARVVRGYDPAPLPAPTLEVAADRRETIAHVQGIIDDRSPEEVAVVVDPDGPYWPILSGRLTATGIPHSGHATSHDGLADAFLALLRLTVESSNPTVDRARAVLTAIGATPADTAGPRPVASLDDERAVWVDAVAKHGHTLTIGQLLDQFAFRADAPLPTVREVVRRIGLTDDPPTARSVGDLTYCLRWRWTADDPPDGAVLLVSPRGTMTINRPTTVFIGPAIDWLASSPPGIGPLWDSRERRRLARLFAAGSERRFVAADGELAASRIAAVVGEPAVTAVEPAREHAPDGIQFEPEGRPRSGSDRFTKTKLNRLLSSPRDALYGSLLKSPERAERSRGTALHEYAELRTAAPDDVEALGRDRIIDDIVADIGQLVPAHRRELLSGRIEAAIAVIDAYLSSVDGDGRGIEGFVAPAWKENTLADRYGIDVVSSIAEQYFVDETLDISGVVDLIKSPTHLVDFKTGAPRRVERLVSLGRVDQPVRRPDVQLPLYLAALRRRMPDRPLAMSFVYCYGWLPGSIGHRPNVDALTRTVRYVPRPVESVVTDAETVDRVLTAVPADHPRRRLGSTLGHDRVVSVLGEVTTEAEIDDRALRTRLVELAREVGLSPSIAAAGARSLVLGLNDYHERQLFGDDLDAFEEFLEHWRSRRDRFDREGYPLGDPRETDLEFPEMHPDLSPLETDGDR